MAEPPLDRLEDLFQRAADLPPESRAAFLDEQCGGDAGLRGAVEALLRSDQTLGDSDDFLRGPLGAGRDRPAVPERLGRYRVLRPLGAGGMGAVYEAEQDSPRRTVALKVIHPALSSPSLVRRFAREAEVLGRLHHPGIAQVYDAGVAEGRPYFAMELIAGVPLDEHARLRSLTPAARLELLARVADAVQHANEQGVVHRDLKPSNILVEESGRPKVLDFGVARVADADLQSATARTEAGQLLGTLRYMSPEQVSADPAALDGRSDVYALGVILYELLAGRPPYGLEHLPLPEAARRIREQEPTPLGALDARLRGDVETIVAKALEKEPARRYASAGEFAADLRRHLHNEPIQARPPSALYQLGKFARRHRALVGGVVAVMLALAAGAVCSFVYAVRADGSARAATENERQARYQTYRARLAAAAAALQGHDVGDAGRQLAEAPEEFRRWEWRHLNSRLDDSTAAVPAPAAGRTVVLPHGPSGFRLVTFTADAVILADENGRRLASAPRTIQAEQPHAAFLAGDAAWVAYVADPEGRTVLTLDGTGQVRAAVREPGDVKAQATAFSPDGTRLAVGWGNGRIVIYDAVTGAETARWAGSETQPLQLTFSPDGRLLAEAADEPVARVWDAGSGRPVAELRGHTSKVDGIAFRPDGERVVTASADGTVRQWDARTGREVEPPYERHAGTVLAVAYSPDGRRVASAGEDRAIRVWWAEGRQDEAVLRGHTTTVTGLAFAADGRRLASSDRAGGVRLWETGPDATLPVLRGHTSYVYPVAFSPDGRRIASGAWDGTVRLWDAATGEEVACRSQGGNVRALAFSPDGTRLATMGDGGDGLRVRDVATGRLLATHRLEGNTLWAVLYRPDGAHVAALGNDNAIEVLEAETGRRVAVLDTGIRTPPARRPLAYSPDGRLLAGPSDMKQIGLWDGETYRRLATLPGHDKDVLSLAFSADGRLLVSAGADSLVRVWDVATRECRLVLRGHADEVFSAVFHPDGSRIASGGRDRLIRLWDTATGEELVRLPGHANYVFSLAFSPDGKTLVSGSGDGTLRLWDTAPLRERYRARQGTR